MPEGAVFVEHDADVAEEIGVAEGDGEIGEDGGRRAVLGSLAPEVEGGAVERVAAGRLDDEEDQDGEERGRMIAEEGSADQGDAGGREIGAIFQDDLNDGRERVEEDGEEKREGERERGDDWKEFPQRRPWLREEP